MTTSLPDVLRRRLLLALTPAFVSCSAPATPATATPAPTAGATQPTASGSAAPFKPQRPEMGEGRPLVVAARRVSAALAPCAAWA